MSTAKDEKDWENEEGTHSSHSSGSSQSSSTNSSRDSDATGSSLSGSGSEQEDLKDYKRGGYHPLKPKDFLNNRYLIIRKLGWGHFSTVWMAFDQQDKDFKALKVVRSAKTYTETARDEIELLEHAAEADVSDSARESLVQLHEHFEIDGPFGHHIVLVMEITGPSLFSVSRRAGSNGLKLHTVRNLTKRILEALAYMHDKAHMIHTDLKPENISLAIGFEEKLKMAKEALHFTNSNTVMPRNYVSTYFWQNAEPDIAALSKAPPKQECGGDMSSLCDMFVGDSTMDPNTPPSSKASSPDPAREICDPLIKIVDMGNACWTYKKFTNDIQTREYRSFEIIMGSDYQANVDIWSLGCVVFELATGDYLFNPRHGDDFATDEDHVAQMIERLGMPGRRIACKGKYHHKFFNRRGSFKCFDQKEMDPQTIAELLMDEYRWKENEARSFAQFIEDCLVYDPASRPSAATLLNHAFFTAELSEDYVVESPAKSNNDAGDTNAGTDVTMGGDVPLKSSVNDSPPELLQNQGSQHSSEGELGKAMSFPLGNPHGRSGVVDADNFGSLRKTSSSQNYESFMHGKIQETSSSSTNI